MAVFIDNRRFDADPAKNLLDVCLSLGFDLPYFCWHPALGSVGACRQCAVKQYRDEHDTHGRIVMACMTPATDGTRCSIDDAEAVAFRKSVIEWLMINHPHDCPVCDEGGECHLQDMTVMTGHDYRRYRFPKRTYRNQYLGPFVHHEMNRCIQCYRCVRFYRDHAGGRDLDVFGVHDHVYFGRAEEGVLENEFSGNLVEVCPTGVFTDETLHHHYTRKWDLQTAPSLCVHCGVGCNTTPGERYGELRRIINRYNSRVNGYFLCDRGRFGYEFVNAEQRIRRPHLRAGRAQPLAPTDAKTALQQVAPWLQRPDALIGIGSPRASLESNFALLKLVGPTRFFLGLSEAERASMDAIMTILRDGPAPAASIEDIESADAVLVLGEDVLNTAPRFALALLQSVRQQPMRDLADPRQIPRWHDAAVRDAVQRRHGPLFLVGSRRTWLHESATEAPVLAPDDTARVGFAVAHAIQADAPAVNGLSAEQEALVRRMADALTTGRRPVIISGAASGSAATIQAAAHVAWALQGVGVPASLAFVVPGCNAMGLAMLGGGDLQAAERAVQARPDHTVIVLEQDVFRAEPVEGRSLVESAGRVIVLDHVRTETTGRADAAFPAATFAEADGTLINYEGRAQRHVQVFPGQEEVQESWRWIRDIARIAGRTDLAWESLDDVVAELARDFPLLEGVMRAAPPAGTRFVGEKVPRQSHRFSGRTAMVADRTVHEPKPPADPDSPLTFSMEGYPGQPPSPLIPMFWAPGWNSIQSVNKFQAEVGGPLRTENPGIRLFEPRAGGPTWFQTVPPPFAARAGEWLILPQYEVFGSDELSALSRSVASRIPVMAVTVHPSDAARLGVSAGERVQLSVEDDHLVLALRCGDDVPPATARLSLVPGHHMALPAWGKLEKVVA